jgi:hypothetical protein
MNALTFTLYESRRPSVLTKSIELREDGTLAKTPAAQMTDGIARTVVVADLAEFAATLDALTSAQAVGYGVAPAHDYARVVTDAAWNALDDAAKREVIARTRRFLQFAPRPGVMMLDHDGHPDGEIHPERLHAMIVEAVPALADAQMLWRASAGSCIVGTDGRMLSGLGGQRLYVAVRDASLIPRAGEALVSRLEAAGHAWVKVSRAGATLQRTLVDASVWQPERLDFAGPPVLGPGLRREPPPARLLGLADAPPFDLRRIEADGEVQAAAKKYRAQTRAAAEPEARTAREAYIEAEAPKIAERRGIELEAARAIVQRATTKHVLMGDFVLTAHDGAEVTVGELLDNPARWHGQRFADPLEPEYGNRDRRIAWANLRSGGKPFIYSHAHGGQRYVLARPARRIQLARGDRARVVDQVLDAIRAEGELYDFGEGGGMARLADGAALPVTRDWLLDYLDRTCSFFVVKMVHEMPVEVDADAPPALAASILAKSGERRLPRLVAVTTAPTLRPDGSVLDEPGFDEVSGLLYLAGLNAPRVPREPTPREAIEALRTLWAPVRLFPFVDDVDRGVALAAMVTAGLRASLPTAPGFAFDAPTAGSGKTLMGKVIGILATGESPPVLPPAGDRDDEARKRLFSALRDGRRVLLWDNVREPLGGAALDAFLTAPTFSDRVLGVSEMATLPNRALLIATGNNLRLVGDTCRRILVARIDAQMERPYGRSFDFDPEQYVQAHRLELVVAALTIVRGWIAAGRPRLGTGRTASFETWDDLVRQPVLWVAEQARALGAGLPGFADPVEAVERAFGADPETAKLAALLAAWEACFGERPTAVKEAIRYAEQAGTDPAAQALADALDEAAGERGRVNPRILGRWIERNVGRRNAGRWIEAGRLRDGYKTWALRREDRRPPENNPLKPTTPTSATQDTLQEVGSVDVSGFLPVNGCTLPGAATASGSSVEVF